MAVRTDTYGLDFVFNSKEGEQALSRTGTLAERATQRLKDMVTQKGYLLYAMKRIASYSAIFSFFGGLIKMFGSVIELELRLAEVNTLINKSNQEAVDSYNQVTQELLRLDPHLGNAIDLTKGLYEIISAGVTNPVEAFELLQVSARYAKVGLTDLATASSSLTAVMKAYGLSAEAMRGKSDALFASVREGKYHTDELNEAIGKVLPTAAAMNVSVEEVSAALAVMTQRGLDVNEAATSLNRMLISFLRPMDKAQKQFAKLGWTWGRNAFEGIGLIGALKRLESASKRYGDLLPQIFRRQRALRGAFILQGAGLLDLEEMYGRITDASSGAGIVMQEYQMITKTVSEELKALYANLLQAFSALLQHKGAVASFIKQLSEMLRVIIENMTAVVAFTTVIIAAKKAVILLNTTVGQSILLWALKVRWMLRGATAANAAALAQRNLALATKTVTAALGVLAATLTVAAGVYLIVKGGLDKWHDSLEKQRQAIMDDAVQLKDYYDRMKDIAAIYKKLTGETLEYNRAIKAGARVRVWEELRAGAKALGYDLPKTTRAVEAMFEKANLSVNEYSGEIKSLASYLTGKGFFNKKDFESLDVLFDTLALRMGYTTMGAKEFTDSIAKNVPGMAAAIRKMDDEVLILARDLRMASGEIKSLPGDLARRFDIEELEGMLKAITRLSEGLPGEVIAKLAYFDIDAKKLAEDTLQVESFKGAVEEALRIWETTKATQRIEDYQRTFESTFKSLIYTARQARETGIAFYRAWQEFEEKTPAAMKIVANASRKEIEKILATAKDLPPEVKALLEEMMTYWSQSADKLIKIREKFRKISEQVVDDQEKIASKIAQLENEYNQEKYNNVVEMFKRESIAYKNRAADRYELAKQSGANMLIAAIDYQKSLLQIQEWGNEAQKVAEYRALMERLDEFKKTLNSMEQSTQQRIDTTYRMEEEATKFLERMGIADEKFMNFLASIIHEYFEDIRTETEAGRDVMEEYIKYFRSLATSFSSLSDMFNDLSESMGLQNSALNKLGEFFLIASGAVDAFAKSLKAFHDSEALTGLAATVGKMTAVLGVIVAGFKLGWELGKFLKGLFGGDARTTEEKEADRLAAFITKLQKQLKDLGNISDETAEKIYELVKKGVPEYVAVARSLVDLMDDTGISLKNFEEYLTRMIEALGIGTTYLWNMDEAAEVAAEAFSRIIAFAKEMGIEGHKVILDFIRRAKELGYEIKEISDYIRENLNIAAEGLAKMIKWVAQDAVDAWNAMKDLNKEKKKLLRELAKYEEQMRTLEEGSEAWEKAKEKVDELYKEILKLDRQLAKHHATLSSVGRVTIKQLERLGIITAATFDAMWAEGVSMLEIFSQMGEAVFALMDRYKALGLEVPRYLRGIFQQFRLFRKFPEFFEGLQGLQQGLEGLANSGYLTQDAFKAIYQEALRYFRLLTRARSEGGMGLGDEKAIAMMYPLLQKMWWYAQQYDLKLPKAIRDLIDQAMGLGFKFEKPVLERQLDAIGRLNDRLVWHRKGIRDSLDTTNDLLRQIRDKGHYQHGSTGVSGGLSFLHRGEAVLPENVTSALKRFFVRGGSVGNSGGGGMLEAHIYIDGEKTYKALVPHIRKGGAYADFELDGIGVR